MFALWSLIIIYIINDDFRTFIGRSIDEEEEEEEERFLIAEIFHLQL